MLILLSSYHLLVVCSKQGKVLHAVSFVFVLYKTYKMIHITVTIEK